MISKQLENYLKTIWTLEKEYGSVTTKLVAKYMKISPASVSSMLKKLSGMKLIDYKPYRGASLTQRGEKVALEVLRHHRILELYLSEVVGLPLDQVHDEAEELEHALSEELEAILFEKLGQPKRDPHGDPIPSLNGEMVTEGIRLLDASIGKCHVVIRVRDRNPPILKYLTTLGLQPGTTIILLEKLPFNGPIRIQIGDLEHTLGHEVSEEIFVSSL